MNFKQETPIRRTIKKEPRRILFVQLGDIGDLVLSLPCLRALKESFPRAEIIVVAHQKAAGLLEFCEWVSETVVVRKEERGWWQELKYQVRFISQLRNFGVDLVFDLRTGTRGAFLSIMSGARQRVAFYTISGHWWRRLVYTDLIMPVRISNLAVRHVIDYNLDLLAAFNIAPSSAEPFLAVSDSKMNEIGNLLSSEGVSDLSKIVVIQPYSLWKYKEWASEKFVELIKWLQKDDQFSVVISGGPEDRERAEDIAEQAGNRVYSFAGKTTIEMYAALLKVATMLISVDSVGPHLASAVNTPSVTIYGPASPDAWAPRGEKHLIVQNQMPCVPCNQAGCNGDAGGCECLDELEVQVVASAVQSLVHIEQEGAG